MGKVKSKKSQKEPKAPFIEALENHVALVCTAFEAANANKKIGEDLDKLKIRVLALQEKFDESCENLALMETEMKASWVNVVNQ